MKDELFEETNLPSTDKARKDECELEAEATDEASAKEAALPADVRPLYSKN